MQTLAPIDNRVYAVGSDGHLTSFGSRNTPVPSSLVDVRFKIVSAARFHVCAVDSTNLLHCFGELNRDGELDMPTSLGQVLSVSAGRHHTLALTMDGKLVCFGLNESQQCDIPQNGPFVAVSAGAYHSAAITLDGKAVCFGKQEHGRCAIPRDLPAVKSICAGVRHTCVITHDDHLMVFGDEWRVPDEVGPVKSVAAAEDVSYALTYEGDIVCLHRDGTFNRVAREQGARSIFACDAGVVYVVHEDGKVKAVVGRAVAEGIVVMLPRIEFCSPYKHNAN